MTDWRDSGDPETRYYECDLASAETWKHVKWEATAHNGGDGWIQASELQFFGAYPPMLADAVVSETEGAYTVSAKVTKAAATQAGAVVTASDGTEIGLSAGAVAKDGTFSVDLDSALRADATTYLVSAFVEADGSAATNAIGTVYTGTLALGAVTAAHESGLVAGGVEVSRAHADPYPLTIHYALTSTAEGAEAGRTWETPVPVTIPAGAASVVLPVQPKPDGAVSDDIDVTVTLLDGNYELPETVTAIVPLTNLFAPEGFKTWVAVSDGTASDGANWIPAGAPAAGDRILFDGRFSNAACAWDADAAQTVAELTLAESYTGTVSVGTTYGEAFPDFAVTGDVTIDGGTLSPKSHGTSTTQTYRLKMTVGGDFTVGAAGAVSADARGRQSKYNNWRRAAPHGGESNQNDANDSAVPGFDSIFEPTETGWGSTDGTGTSRVANGGGALHLTVGGTLVNAGRVSANSGTNHEAGGAGGAVYVRAATISGNGTYAANGNKGDKSDGCVAAGAGGRIALVAAGANDADLADITCYGLREAKNTAGGAGTVYLSGANVNALAVRNNNDANNAAVTIVPSPDDVYDPAVWKKIDLLVGRRAHLKLGADLKAQSLTIANGATDDLDLNGKTFVLTGDVTVDGTPLKLKPGEYTLAQAAALGWTWLKDGSATDETPGAGVLRVIGRGFLIVVR